MGRENFLSRLVSGTTSAVYAVGSAALKGAKAVTNGALSLVKQSIGGGEISENLKEAISIGSEVKELDNARNSQQTSSNQFEGKKLPVEGEKKINVQGWKNLNFFEKIERIKSNKWETPGVVLAAIAVDLENAANLSPDVGKLIFGEFGQGGALWSGNVTEFIKELKVQIGDLERLKKQIDDSKFGILRPDTPGANKGDEMVFKAIQNSIQPNSVIGMIDTLGIQKAHLFGNRIFNEQISRAIYPEFMMHPITEEVRAQVAENLVALAERFGGAKNGDLPDIIYKAVCKAIKVLNVEQAEKVAKAMGIKSKEDFEHLETQEAAKNNEEIAQDSGLVAHAKKPRREWLKNKIGSPEQNNENVSLEFSGKNKENASSTSSQSNGKGALNLKKAFEEAQLRGKTQFSFLETENSGN